MTNTVLGSILAVFDAIGQWFSTFVPTLFVLFWTPGASTGDPGQLTFLGVLAVASLAISIVFLVNSTAHSSGDGCSESPLIAGNTL